MKLIIKNNHIPRSVINATAKNVLPYLHRLKKQPETFMKLPANRAVFTEVARVARNYKNIKYIFVIGIGGSSLGTKAIYDAQIGYRDLWQPKRTPKMLFADTTDPEIVSAQTTFVSKQKPNSILFVIVSKSGGTTETLVDAEILLHAHRSKDNIVVITDHGSPLWREAQKKKVMCIGIPQEVGGRYSVFSAIGLLPLAIAGIDIKALRNGASTMHAKCLDADPAKNPALASAAVLFNHYKKGRKINTLFLFHPELETLGKWYRQLVAESLGKNSRGFTPDVSIGSTDLHSMAQLYLDGPRDKITTFIYSTPQPSVPRVPKKTVFGDLSAFLKGKSAIEIMNAILTGTKHAYIKQKLPFMEIELSRLDAAELGAFMQFKMMETIFLATLMGVNAFDQPAVELYKEETRKLLL